MEIGSGDGADMKAFRQRVTRRRLCLYMSGTAVGMLFALGLAPLPAGAQSLPSGGSVTNGSATITQSGANLLIEQSSRNAIISWSGFSIGGGATAHFENGTGATLNRVTGNLPSAINGSLTATGSLYLINPAGVTVGTGGMVRTGGSFIASTHDATDADFLDGGALTLKGDSKAAVVNRGFVTSLSGDVVLTARRVENAGTIEAPNGSVGLLGGYEVELRDTSLADGKFAVKVGGADTEVVNSGTVRAAEIEMRANGGSVQALAGNTKAIVKATGVKKAGGRIFLTAGSGGTVKVTQRLVARRAVKPAQQAEVAALPDTGPVPAARPDFSGGEVHMAGGTVSLGGEINAAGAGGKGGTIVAVAEDRLELTDKAALDASGADGGLVLLGGDYQGGGNAAASYWTAPLGTTAVTSVAAGATVAADGAEGAGGHVVVWGDDRTDFAGTISAIGATRGGDAEVSGKATLAYTGFTDLSAANGAFGNLLLDPYDVTIVSGTGGTAHGGVFTATAKNSVIGADTVLAALEAANVTVSTGTAGSQNGDITVNADLNWSTNATLTLQAARDIILHNAITARAGGLTLNAGAFVDPRAGGAAVEVARFTLQSGLWSQKMSTLPAFAAGDFRITGGGFLRAIGGSNTVADPDRIVDVYGLQGMTSFPTRNYALAKDIDASGTKYWWDGKGFAPIGTGAAGYFTGTFDGRGHAVVGLTVNRPSEYYVGLFGYASGATIRNVGVENAATTGYGYAGGLVGNQTGGSIDKSWASGTVTGLDSIGGLVGLQQTGGVIRQSWTSAAVTATDQYGKAGGLVGAQGGGGSIEQSFASGSVTATGVNSYGGGLVGSQYGSISQSWASGLVTSTDAGGLVGKQFSSGTVTQSYWDKDTTHQVNGYGARTGSPTFSATGLTTAQARQGKTVTAYSDWDFTNVWYQAGDMRPILRSAVGPSVNGVVQISSAVQLQAMGANPKGSFALTRDIDASATNGANPAGIWGAGGFVPVGNDDTTFAGTFDGGGHVISGLTINRPSKDYIGLFGVADGSTIRNLGLSGVAITGRYYVGGLVGWQWFGSITQSSVGGTVTGTGSGLDNGALTGGLVGLQYSGSITQSWASGSVTTTGNGAAIGGLVGGQDGLQGSSHGNIKESWASAAVTATGNDVTAGGLLGLQWGEVIQSWASGTVTATGDKALAGGLTGLQDDGSSISKSWATGSVSAIGDNALAGGLAGGAHAGSITESSASGSVAAKGALVKAGGLVGGQEAGTTVSRSWASGSVTATGENALAGGVTGVLHKSSITEAWASGKVEATGTGTPLHRRAGGPAGGRQQQHKAILLGPGHDGPERRARRLER